MTLRSKDDMLPEKIIVTMAEITLGILGFGISAMLGLAHPLIGFVMALLLFVFIGFMIYTVWFE